MKAKKDSMEQHKLDWALLTVDLREVLELVVEVLQHGAEKYGVKNWQGDENRDEFIRHILSARERHFSSDMKGEMLDPESQLPHLAHLIVNDLFLLWFRLYWQDQIHDG